LPKLNWFITGGVFATQEDSTSEDPVTADIGPRASISIDESTQENSFQAQIPVPPPPPPSADQLQASTSNSTKGDTEGHEANDRNMKRSREDNPSVASMPGAIPAASSFVAANKPSWHKRIKMESEGPPNEALKKTEAVEIKSDEDAAAFSGQMTETISVFSGWEAQEALSIDMAETTSKEHAEGMHDIPSVGIRERAQMSSAILAGESGEIIDFLDADYWSSPPTPDLVLSESSSANPSPCFRQHLGTASGHP
jgi:hypothetical protein